MNHQAAEFFAGIGLVRMALERAGWAVAFANDISPQKFEIYRDNFGHHEFRLSDIREIVPEAIPNISLATASFPCIDVSLAGNRAGLKGRHSSAYWEFHRLIEGMGRRRPEHVLLENVVGLLSSGEGKDLRKIILSLNRLGYSCDLVLLDAADFVPQSRPRLFIIGRLDSGGMQYPYQSEVRPSQVLRFIERNSDLNWSLPELPSLPRRQTRLEDIVERFAASDSIWWDRTRKTHLFRQVSPRHRLVLHSMVKGETLSYATVYKRVRPQGCRAEIRADGIAGCLRTPLGGSSKQFLIEAGMGEWRIRNMTAREYARLQGVPDTFRINVPYNRALLGFGDAVCVPVVEWILSNCLSQSEERVAVAV